MPPSHRRVALTARLTCVLGLGACLATPAAYQTASPADIQAQQRAAMAQSLGYPTRKSPAELEQVIAQQTRDGKPEGRRFTGQLEAPSY